MSFDDRHQVFQVDVAVVVDVDFVVDVDVYVVVDGVDVVGVVDVDVDVVVAVAVVANSRKFAHWIIFFISFHWRQNLSLLKTTYYANF